METFALFEDGPARRITFCWGLPPDENQGPIKAIPVSGTDDLQMRQAAERGFYTAYDVLVDMGYITGTKYCFAYELEGERYAVGSSAGLAFALKFAQKVYCDTERPLDYDLAATGVIRDVQDAQITRVNGLHSKLRDALERLHRGDCIYYPAANEVNIDDELRTVSRDKGIALTAVATIREAITKLLPPAPRLKQARARPRSIDTTPLLHRFIFLSSPSDVSHERQLAREVIDRIQNERAHQKRLKLHIVAWDKAGAGTAMPAHLEPQEAMNRRLKRPSECDIVIAIFWSRMGTLLSERYPKLDDSRYRSGTEFDCLNALEAANKSGKPDVFVYRRREVPTLKYDDPDRQEKLKQWDQVEQFFAELKNSDGSCHRSFYEYNTPSDFEDMLDQHLRKIIRQYLDSNSVDASEVADVPQEPVWPGSPYPGLLAFTRDQAPIFFGRSRETDGLIRKLSDSSNRFIVVIGASGSGKSSLVAAGLWSRLDKDAINGSRDWLWMRFTPCEVSDDNPFMTLAVQLALHVTKYGRQIRDLAMDLYHHSRALHDINDYPRKLDPFFQMALKGRPSGAEIVLFVDQLEELFTLVQDEYRGPFINLLCQAARLPRIRVVATLRADFYHRCLEWPAFSELLRDGSYTLAAPGIGALHAMITGPAARAGLTFEDGLVQDIIDETGNAPGALPLMAFALSELYKEKADGTLTHKAYTRFKGVKGAIGKRAEDTFLNLKGKRSSMERSLAGVFRELVEVNELGVPTRRRTSRSQVDRSPDAKDLVDALIEARLLVAWSEDSEPVVEVAHEAILTSWPRLAAWIETTREDLRLRRQLAHAATEWEMHGEEEKYLWPNERVIEDVAGMLERLGLQMDDLSETEQRFLGPIAPEAMFKELEDMVTTHKRRATIGLRLSLLGDPRPGVGLRSDGLPDIVYCKVPGGEITIEEGAGTFRVEPFHIAKYPITWKQYQAFLNAPDGFGNPQWWEGFFQVHEPGRQFNRQDNHPAENLCWNEAVAFCRWLSERLGYEIRLPTEWEWQQAATGGDLNHMYPWGIEWHSGLANTCESELSCSTAVGMYPHGASLDGVLDMCGNVWEWCLNEPDNNAESLRAVRGGSWAEKKFHARAANRYNAPPDSQNYNLGLRVMRPSPVV